MDQHILKPSNNDITTIPGDGITPDRTVSNRDVNFLSLTGYFSVENPTSAQEESMNYIMSFFEKSGVLTMSDVLLSLRSIEMKLGVTPVGQDRITSIKNYLKISDTIAEMQRQRSAMER